MIGFGLAADGSKGGKREFTRHHISSVSARFLLVYVFVFCIFLKCNFSFDIFFSFALSFLF